MQFPAGLTMQFRSGARVGVLLLALLPTALGVTGMRFLLHAGASAVAGAHALPADAAAAGSARASIAGASLPLHDEANCGLCAAVRAASHASAPSAAAVAVHALASHRAIRATGFAFTRDGHLHQPSTRAPPRSRA